MAKGRCKKYENINIQSVSLPYSIGSMKFTNSDWTTEAFLFPRDTDISKVTDNDLNANALYFLIGTDGITEKIYVGQGKKRNSGEAVLRRLREHKDSVTESYRNHWSYIIVLTSSNDSWTEGDVSALERIFYNFIPAENRLNGNEPRGDLSIECSEKVEHIKAYLEVIGVNLFISSEETQEQITVQQIIEESEAVEDLHKGSRSIPEIVTPLKVVKKMVDLIPEEMFNSDTVFFDPACKGGEYLKEIYDRLMESEALKAKFPSIIERSNHILTNQLFGIALSQVSYERTKNKLLGFAYNIRIIGGYIEKLKDLQKQGICNYHNTQYTYQGLLEEVFGRKMNIDIVIGNPPYQENNGGGRDGMSGKTIYDRFIDTSLGLAKMVCMIVKDNWMSYKGLEYTRNNIIKHGLVKIIDYPIPKEVFNNVGVAVNIFLVSNGYEGNTHFIEIRNGKKTSEYSEKLEACAHIPTCAEEIAIMKKIKACSNKWFSDHVESAYPFGIKSNGVNKEGYVVDSSVIPTEEYDIPIMFMDNSNDTYLSYISRDSIQKNEDKIKEYKIICGLQLNRNSRIITNIHGLKPSSICSGSFGLLYSSGSELETINACKYIKTKFFRSILYWCIDTKSTVAPYRFEMIPEQNFSSQSDIDWSQSIDNIDKQLYQKYNLSTDEINYIESTIKPI